MLRELERREQCTQARAVVTRRALDAFEPRARLLPQRRIRERRSDLLPLALQALQGEVQAAAPFAERCVRLGKEPGDAGHAWEIDFAARAPPRGAGCGERRIAARAGQELAEKVSRHGGRIVALVVIVAAFQAHGPCTAHVM
jgi:hypothetical protein